MENQPIIQPESSKKFPVIATVLIFVVLTALIVGGGVYFWQNMKLKEVEVAAPEVTPIVKPIVTSPLNGATIENASDGVKITGKAAPNSTVWLFQVSEMDPNCLSMASALTLGDKADAGGNFEITYVPSSDVESWPWFAVVALDENQKYQLNWVNGAICAPNETKSDSFHLILKSIATPITYTNNEYGFSLVFPATWGAIEEKDILNLGADKYIVKSIDLVSKTDKDRWLKIDVIKRENKNDPENIDYPHTFITENSQYAFYYYGAGDYAGAPGMEDPKWFVTADEIKQIVQTFILK